MAEGISISIYAYTDYREYLRDYYLLRKQKSPTFSFRQFALQSKITSPNYLKLVIDGKRRITDKYLNHFIRGLKLERHEADFFKSLVLYTDCGTNSEDKKQYLDQIIRLKNRSQRRAQQVDGTMIAFLQHWYICVVRELTLLPDFEPDPKWISQRMNQRISPKQAKEAFDCLLDLKMIQKDSDGKYKPSEALLTTGDEGEQRLVVRRLHHQFSCLSASAILETDPDNRETCGLTIAFSKKRLPAVKALIREFRQNLNQVLTSNDGNDEVYHLALNFFPLSKRSLEK